ncbi:hypothetical protein AYI69_g4457, partial [Smittium culicis]
VQDPSIDPTKNSDQIEDDSRKKVFKAGYQDNRGGNFDPTLKKRDRTGFLRHTRILFDDVYSSKKIRRNSPSFKSETSESSSASKALQNGESFDCMQACSPQRLDDKHRSCRHIPSRSFFSIFKEISQFSMGKQKFSLPRSFIWPFLEPTSFHEGIALSSQMDKTSWDKDKCLPGRFVDLRIEQGGITEEHTEETWRDPISCSAQGLRAVVGPLSEFFDSPTAELRPFCTKSSRCSFKHGYTEGMVNIRQDIQEDRFEVWTARCGYVRSPGEPQTAEIFHLETISRSSSNGRFQSLVEYLEEFILLPTLESHHEDNPEGP